jgi:DNA-binding response OmpR family regulator
MTGIELMLADLKPETVLIVESDVLMRMALSQYLRDCELKVIEAADGDEAIIVLLEPDLDIDVILCNAQISGTVGGFGLSHWVKVNKGGIPIVLVGTPGSASEAAEDICEAGPAHAKPYDSQVLVGRIRGLLAERDTAPQGNVRRPGDAIRVQQRP